MQDAKKIPTLPRSTFHNSLSYTFPIHSPIILFSALTILLKCSVKQPSKTRSRSWLPSAVHINSSSLITREFFHTQKNANTTPPLGTPFHVHRLVLLRTKAIFYPFYKNHFLFLLSRARCHCSDLNDWSCSSFARRL